MGEVNVPLTYVTCAEGKQHQAGAQALITQVANRYLNDALVYSVEIFLSMVI